MKQTTILTSIILSMVILGYTQSITVTKPGTGDVWYTGTGYYITWTKTPDTGSFVKIKLRNLTGGKLIIEKTDNDGSFYWDIPDSLAAGKYRIRVKDYDTLVSDDSDTFEIKQGPPNYLKAFVPKPVQMAKGAPLHIVSPVKGETWRMGESKTIKWNSLSDAPNTLSIYIIAKNLGRAGPVWIARNISNKGFCEWDIPVNPTKPRFQAGKYHMVFRGPTGKDLTKREFNIDNPTTISLFPSGNSSFTILDNLQWSFAGKGKLGILTINIKANSENDFALLGTTDGVDFGTQWLKCWVTCKVPIADVNTQPKEEVKVKGKFSVSGNNGTQKFYKAPAFPTIIKKNGTYKLSFKFKDHTGVLCYIDFAGKKGQSSFPAIKGKPRYPESCKHYYFPKLEILLYTKLKSGGTITNRKVFYLEYKNLEEAGYTNTWFQVERSYCDLFVKW